MESPADEQVLHLAQFLYAPETLPPEERPQGPIKSATLLVAQIESWLPLTSPEVRAYVNGLRTTHVLNDVCRTTLSGPESILQTEHFSIHYTRGGSDAVPLDDLDGDSIPDYVMVVAEVMEHVWDVEIRQMGWTAPPPDGGRWGNNLYDVYLLDIAPYYGVTCTPPDGVIGDNPNSPSRVERYAAISHLALDNDYKGFDKKPVALIQVTAAHEFNHAIQYGYDSSESYTDAAWLYEGTATWIEDEVYDDVNDNYQYVQSILNEPDTCLTSAFRSARDTHPYGTWIFFRYLSEHVGGPDLIRRIWELTIPYDNLDAVSRALAEQGRTLEDVYADFATALGLLMPCQAFPNGESPYCFEEAPFGNDPYREVRVEGYMTWDGADRSYAPLTGVQPLGVDFWKLSWRSSAPVVIDVLAASFGQARLVRRTSNGVTVWDFTARGDDRELLMAGAEQGTDLLAVINRLRPPSADCSYHTHTYRMALSLSDVTPTPTPEPTATPTSTFTPTPTPTATFTPTPTPTATSPTVTPSPTDVVSSPTPTPTPTASVGPTEPPFLCQELVEDGDFEAGKTASWVESPYGVIYERKDGAITHSGTWAAWFGGYANANDTLYQTLNLPADADRIVVSYWVYVYSDQEDIAGRLRVQMRTEGGVSLEDINTWTSIHPRFVWMHVQRDVTALRGHKVRLFFHGTTTAAGTHTGFFVDDVSVQACYRRPWIQNGDFEQGLDGWTSGGTLPTAVVTDVVHHGAQSVRLGTPVPATEQGQGQALITQTITVPLGMASPSLSFWYRIFTNDIQDYSDFVVLVQDAFGHTHRLFRAGYTSAGNYAPPPGYDMGWQQGTIDLTDFRGQSVYLSLVNENLHAISLGIWTYVDEVLLVDDVVRGDRHVYLPALFREGRFACCYARENVESDRVFVAPAKRHTE